MCAYLAAAVGGRAVKCGRRSRDVLVGITHGAQCITYASRGDFIATLESIGVLFVSAVTHRNGVLGSDLGRHGLWDPVTDDERKYADENAKAEGDAPPPLDELFVRQNGLFTDRCKARVGYRYVTAIGTHDATQSLGLHAPSIWLLPKPRRRCLLLTVITNARNELQLGR